MPADLPPPTPAGRVVRLLWSMARRRSRAREKRQRELLGRCRAGDSASAFGGLTRLFVIIVVCMVHAALGWIMIRTVEKPGSVATHDGRIEVGVEHQHFLDALASSQATVDRQKRQLAESTGITMADRRHLIDAERTRDRALTRLTQRLVPNTRAGRGSAPSQRDLIAQRFRKEGAAAFVVVDTSLRAQLAHPGSSAAPLCAVFLVWWLAMLVCQGEGLELDVQRRRHPMWEWLLSHPIRPAHAFYSELLAPLMANPIYATAPVFLWVVLRPVLGDGRAVITAILAGLPVAAACSALNKALENVALLRLGVRSRGAVLGLCSWFGYVAMIVPFFLTQFEGFGHSLSGLMETLAPWTPEWPIRALITGWESSPGPVEIVSSWWMVAAGLGLLALLLTQRSTALGLQPPTDGTGPQSVRSLSPDSRFGRNPLHRKELLWLLRDKGAIVQVLLIPLTIAVVQAFNFRGLYRLATFNWALLGGVAIVCGTYFLLVLGPRSLASEGGALWLSLTWPRGLEDLLRAKARLWSRIADSIVGAILAIACYLFPSAWWQIALVGAGWLVFSRTLALKAVALVTAPSSSGEAQPPNRARQWIALLGTLAFGMGVMTQTWHVAVIGIVFSSLVAVAMWQGLRARLPYLFDPWSEQPVPAPSLLHATVGIAITVELVGVAMAIASVSSGTSALWLTRTISYCLFSGIACFAIQSFLSARDVPFREIINWAPSGPKTPLWSSLVLSIGLGAAMGALAMGYLFLLRFIPAGADAIREAAEMVSQYQDQRFWIAVLVVGLAPPAEEYLFRGLLYRSLDRELGDWRALLLSAAFFAILHPPISWLPVAGLGVLNAWLFKRTGHLFPCVLAHAIYNACVMFFPS